MTNQLRNIRNLAIALVVALALSVSGYAQSTYTTTTLSVAITSKTSRNVALASTTNVFGPQLGVAQGGVGSPNPAGNITYLYVDREIMRVTGAPLTGNLVPVERGSDGTAATPHASGATVYVGYAYTFPQYGQPIYELGGSCTSYPNAFLPFFDPATGNEWNCLTTGPTANQWTKVGTVDTFTFTDGVMFVPPSACYGTVTTTAFTATYPLYARAAANNEVQRFGTTSTAGTLTIDCELSNVASRLTATKGATITSVDFLYGEQTTALASIAAATIASVTYPASTAAGAAAAGTVAAIGGTYTVTPTSLQTATTTSGQCYNEKVSFGTPYQVNADNTNLTFEQIFTTAGSTASITEVCGLLVHYTIVPF